MIIIADGSIFFDRNFPCFQMASTFNCKLKLVNVISILNSNKFMENYFLLNITVIHYHLQVVFGHLIYL